MSDYKLLALDLDHTALNSNTELSPQNKAAIARARAAGIYVAIATGRSAMGAHHVWRDMECDDLAICFGGAQIFDMRAFSPIMTRCMDSSDVSAALALGHKLGLESQIYIGHDIVCEKITPYVERYCQILKLPLPIVDTDMCDKQWDDVIKVLFYAPEGIWREEISALRASVAESLGGRISVTASLKLIEMNAHGLDKSTGLEYLCDKLNIPIEQSVAAGDSLLDLEMIQRAGLGVAVADASSEVINAADVIAPDSDSSPIDWIVKKMLNG